MFVEKVENTRRLVISDIHGCSKTLRVLIEDKVIPTKTDQLFFLGDYIDRGPDSAGVLDYIIQLRDMGYNLFLLRGNHEENLLNAAKEYDRETFIFFVKRINKSMALLDDEGKIKKEYIVLFENLNYYFETDNHFIVHAGFNFSTEKPFDDRISMLELRRTEIEKGKAFIGNKTVVHGHQVTPLCEIELAVNERKKLIPLDNGCYYTKPHKIYDISQTGNLCCFDLDSHQLIIQRNIEG